MSIITVDDAAHNPYHALIDDGCFFCGERITPPAVWWGGSTGTGFVALHPACCVELAIRLLRDVHQVEREMGAYVTSRTLPELRERLLHEEQQP